MQSPNTRGLVHRLRNCLQTILELEPELEQLDLGDSLLKEFSMLKTFLSRIEAIDLEETDVERIEHATASFLAELRLPLNLLEDDCARRRIMH
jgi:hypothetical protein